MLNDSNITISEREKKMNRITLLMILAGAAASVCLVFLFIHIFNSNNAAAAPEISDFKQIGATDSSVLLSWNSSGAASEFVVRYKPCSRNEYTEFRTASPFAAIHGLAPYTDYDAQVSPVDERGEHTPVSLVCSTSPFCHVTSVEVTNIQNNSAQVTWTYDGIDNGFSVVAYAIDKDGKRHAVSESVTIAKGAESRCTVGNLLSEVNYTVCVMPVTKYFTVGKSTFVTQKYSRGYNNLNIIRFAICTPDSDDSMRVNSVKTLTFEQPYRASMIINGASDSSDKVDLTIYITDKNNNFISEFKKPGVYTNPENKDSFYYRMINADFTAPKEPGEYYIFCAMDGNTVIKNDLKVVN